MIQCMIRHPEREFLSSEDHEHFYAAIERKVSQFAENSYRQSARRIAVPTLER